MKIQAKKKSFWSTFKNAYFRSKDLKRFWYKFDKKNLTEELIKTFNLYLSSESYKWSSKFWRHLAMNHLNLIANKKNKNYENLISQEYFTFTYINEPLIKDAWDKVQEKNLDIKINLFKKQNSYTLTQSINHNLILLLLYENIKNKDVFKHFNKLKKDNIVNNQKPSLTIDGLEITQDDLNSLFEYEKIDRLLNKLSLTKNTFLEIGAGAGRTAKTILSIKNNIKYIIADIPPAINICLNNLRNFFPEKKIFMGFEIDKQSDLMNALHKNDIIFVFPHQIKLFENDTFDISIAIDCLHEMEQKTIKNYMIDFEKVSKLLYFKVWENSGLPYSFYQYYSVHRKEDYLIKDHWIEHLKERCLYPSNFFQLGYEFKKTSL